MVQHNSIDHTGVTGVSTVSYASNANSVASASAGGAATTVTRGDHVHLGVRSIAHTSNTFSGPVTLVAEGSVGITSPSSGTLAISSVAGGGGAAAATTSKVVRKTADEDVTGSTTLQNDDHLVFAIAANETWVAEAHIYMAGVTSNTPDIKFGWTVPSGATVRHSVLGFAAGATANEASVRIQSHSTGTTALAVGAVSVATIDSYALVTVSVANGANAGNVQLQWAQNTSDAANTRVFAGSFLVAHKVT